MLSSLTVKWSLLLLVSLGFACIAIGVILGIVHVTSASSVTTQHTANSTVHPVMLIGPLTFLLSIIRLLLLMAYFCCLGCYTQIHGLNLFTRWRHFATPQPSNGLLIHSSLYIVHSVVDDTFSFSEMYHTFLGFRKFTKYGE